MATNSVRWGWSNYSWLKASVWYSSNNIASNYSTFSYEIEFQGDRSYGYSGDISWTISDQWSNNRVSGTKGEFYYNNYQNVTIAKGTFKIYNNPDGTMPAIYFKVYVNSDKSGMGGSRTIPLTVTGVPTIPRQSSIKATNNPTIPGQNLTYNVTAHASHFTHKVELKVGGKHVTGASGVKGGNGTLTLTAEHQDQIMNEMPNSTSVRFQLAISTWNGSTQIGSTQYATGTFYLSGSIGPSFTSLTYSETNENVTNKVGKPVQSVSKLRLNINGASGNKGSRVTAYKITFDGQQLNAQSGVTQAIRGSGNLTATGTITDSRGRTASKSITINVLAYAPPKITGASFIRTTSTGVADPYGTYAKLSVTYQISSLNNDGEKNNATIRMSTKPRGNGSWTIKHTQAGGLSGTVSKIISGVPTSEAYDTKVEIIDIFLTSLSNGQIPIGLVTMEWTKNGISVGKRYQHGTLDVAGDIYQNDRKVMDFNSQPDTMPSGSNADSYWKHGVWQVTHNELARTIQNLPVQIAGRLTTYTLRDLTNVSANQPWIESYQEYLDLTNLVWRRKRLVDGSGKVSWSSWQMDGMPEYGVAGNAWWYKYPDGRLECFLRTNCNGIQGKWAGHFYGYLDVKNWTFPVPFVAPPLMTGSCNVSVARFDAEKIFTTGAEGMQLLRETDTTQVSSVIVKAEGRWRN